MALLTVRLTRWFCHEGCGGCDLSPVINGLKKFIKKYPESLLADNVKYNLIEMSTWYVTEDEDIQAYNSDYRDFILKYPESDKIADARYNFFTFLHTFSPRNVAEILKTGREFVKKHPADPRVKDVKISLEIAATQK